MDFIGSLPLRIRDDQWNRAEVKDLIYKFCKKHQGRITHDGIYKISGNPNFERLVKDISRIFSTTSLLHSSTVGRHAKKRCVEDRDIITNPIYDWSPPNTRSAFEWYYNYTQQLRSALSKQFTSSMGNAKGMCCYLFWQNFLNHKFASGALCIRRTLLPHRLSLDRGIFDFGNSWIIF